MAHDNSWTAVLDPGHATDFFAVANLRPHCNPNTERWHLGNAWWCSEISRTMYRRSDRAARFQQVGLRELQFFDEGGTQAALLATESHAVLVFRGTTNLRDWWTNVQVAPQPWSLGGQVHAGFARALHKVWPHAARAITQLHLPTFVTGHSLGGALATLACAHHAFVAAYTFGAPRVGDKTFLRSLQSPLYRVVNDRDVVPTLPPKSMGYQHGGALQHLAEHSPGEAQARDPSPADLATAATALQARDWLQPPAPISNHAPCNYSALLLAANSAQL